MVYKITVNSRSVKKNLPRGVNAIEPEAVAESQRRRLLDAMKTLAASRGYPDVTIAELVREAGVAKPTFYKCFSDKEDCFVQLFDEVWQGIIAAMVDQIPEGSTSFERIDIGLDVFIDHLAADEDGARVVLIEPLRAGEQAAVRLRNALDTFAAVYRQSREELRAKNPELPSISETRALAIVGAVNEPVAAALRAGRAQDLGDLRDELRDVVHALAFAER